jgi:hypothetical protein
VLVLVGDGVVVVVVVGVTVCALTKLVATKNEKTIVIIPRAIVLIIFSPPFASS